MVYLICACRRHTEGRVICLSPLHFQLSIPLSYDKSKSNMSETNSMTVGLVTILTACILVEGRDILPDVLEMKISQT